MDKQLVDQVLEAAAKVVAGGAISANGHGNVSIRVPGGDEMYYTSAPSLKGLTAYGIVRVGLDGTLLEGSLPPIQGAVVAMHTAMYADSPDVGCVIHTHSPYATAFAVANRPIDCWIEALAMFGLPEGVPVAGYGPARLRRGRREHPGRGAARHAGGAAGQPRRPRVPPERRSSRCWSAASWRRRRRRRSTPRRSGARSRSRRTMRAAALQRAMTFDAAGTTTA